MAKLARISPARLVARILDEPALVTIVQELEAPVLRKLVEHVGLEDAGEIVSLATTEQLERIFDEDLWRSERPGQDETFDAERFALWLEVLMQVGEAQTIEKIVAMDEDLLTLGLAKHVLVIDIDAMAAEMSESHGEEHDQIEKALEGSLYEELEEFRVIAKDSATWDPIVNLLVSLDRDHHALVRRLLERICAASNEYIEDNGGLYEVLTSGQMLESDVAFDREQRREREGFVAPSAAASFLRLARVTKLEDLVASRERDPITKAHFRAAPDAPREAARPSPKVQAFLGELRAAGVLERPARPAPKLEEKTRKKPPLLQRAMIALRDDAKSFSRALDELAYLVNVLIAASGVRAVEANDVVTAVCSLGLSRLIDTKTIADAHLASIAKEHGLVKAFQIGWNLVGVEPWTPKALRGAMKKARSRAK